MKFAALILLVLTLTCSISAHGADTPAAAKPIRVLLTYGVHGFENKEFYAMWDSLPGIKYDKCELPRQADILKPGLEKQYDAVVMYDMAKDWTPDQEKNFIAL